LLRKEFETLPASISGSAQKVQNSFMAWVGGANDALGASTALSGRLMVWRQTLIQWLAGRQFWPLSAVLVCLVVFCPVLRHLQVRC
jgi:phage-related minor tail protein